MRLKNFAIQSGDSKTARTDGFVDLFWLGMRLVGQKSRGKGLHKAPAQALGYFGGSAKRDLPQIVIECDFARFRIHTLATGETLELALPEYYLWITLDCMRDLARRMRCKHAPIRLNLHTPSCY